MFGFVLRLVILFLLNAVVLWALDVHVFEEGFYIEGGKHAYIYVGTIFSLFNIIIKPILHMIAMPFKVITLGLSFLAVNGALLFFIQQLVNNVSELQTVVNVEGIFMYIIVGTIMAFANAVFHAVGLD